MLENLSDGTLLISSNDQAAFKVLFDRYWEDLYKKALHRLGNNADAQDVVQEVFVSLWRNRATIQVDDTLSPYLFTALKYCIIKHVYRKAKKGMLVPLSVSELEQIAIDAENLLLYKELQTDLANELAELPARMQEVYRLSRIEELPVAEIARRLNISEQTVKNTLSTALRRLREKLSRHSIASIFFF